MTFRDLINESKFKVGDMVRIKPQYQDSKDDGEFEIIEINGARAFIRTITHAKSFSRVVPTDLVKLSMLEPVNEGLFTPEIFIKTVEASFKKHFPNGYIKFQYKKGFSDDKYISGVFGMIGNLRDNSNGIPENDKMRHTVMMFENKDGTYSFKGNGKVYINPAEGSYNAMDSIKTKLGNNSKITLEKAAQKLNKFFKKLSGIMQENKDNIYGAETIDKKYMVFK